MNKFRLTFTLALLCGVPALRADRLNIEQLCQAQYRLIKSLEWEVEGTLEHRQLQAAIRAYDRLITQAAQDAQ